MPNYPKKLIEVSIPLKEINEACAREKSIRHGHPSTLHLWWARRPLAAARSVLFCQLVDDPSGYVDELVKDKPSKELAEQELLMEPDGEKDLAPRLKERLIGKERERLHDLVRELVLWENTANEKVLRRARKEIRNSWERQLLREGKPFDTPMPPVLDPFAGGGAIPLEAQRLGMEAHASDLNPVAVLINKAMIEIPPKFSGMPPVNPEWQAKSKEEKAAITWTGAQGLAEDVRYYGQWMRDEAEKRIGHLYPKYELTQELLNEREDLVRAGYSAGDKLTVITWLWARTVPSPNPALGGKAVPLVPNFWLCKKRGSRAYVKPEVHDGEFSFSVQLGDPPDDTLPISQTIQRSGGVCLISGSPMPFSYIRDQAKQGKMSRVGFAVVCEARGGRTYVPAIDEQEASPKNRSGTPLPNNRRDFKTPNYGIKDFEDLYTERQFTAIQTFSDLAVEAASLAAEHSREHNVSPDSEFSDLVERALATYLAFSVSKATTRNCAFALWEPGMGRLAGAMGRQAVPMIWTYAETHPLAGTGGDIAGTAESVAKVVSNLGIGRQGFASQADAQSITHREDFTPIIQTDPPYFDNISYADLSDFFYLWLRKSLSRHYPGLFGGILTPKEDELIAAPHRQGGKEAAEGLFLERMQVAMTGVSEASRSDYPIAIFYAFKQTETTDKGVSSTGWSTFLESLLRAQLSIVGTWPMRTELVSALKRNMSALASSIVLVCRKRPDNATTITKREFIEALEAELPSALRELQHANLSPVDLPQSAIGPGMAVFSRHKEVIKGSGEPMSVTEALQEINHQLSGILDGQVSDMDPWTRFACKWFDQYAFSVGSYGDAEVIANATDVSVDGVVDAGIIESGVGKVRILRPDELPADWQPQTDDNLTTWEIVHHLIRLAETGGDSDCARILAALTSAQSAEARQLCYRLFTTCDQNKWSQEAQGYNQLITSWTIYEDLAAALPAAQAAPTQGDLL